MHYYVTITGWLPRHRRAVICPTWEIAVEVWQRYYARSRRAVIGLEQQGPTAHGGWQTTIIIPACA